MSRRVTRRTFLGAGLLGTAALVQSCHLGRPRGGQLESAGLASVQTAFDAEMESFMAARHVPGGALAVVKDGRLVYARGYGWADRERRIPVEPDSLFRIASISKPITAVAILKLIENGKLALDAPALSVLQLEPLSDEAGRREERWRRITVRQLLQHTGGWDREKSFDPMFRPKAIARAVGSPEPADVHAVIRYMLARPLDFDPGTRYAYSNFGYCMLGRIVEKVTGQAYGQFVRERILASAGIREMRLGTSLDGQQAPREVRYYMSDDAKADSVFPSAPGKVPVPYGGFHLEAMDAHGGWLASAVELARFAAALDHPRRRLLLNRDLLSVMAAPPEPPAWRTEGGVLGDHFYGCGWMVRPVGGSGKANYWHSGSLPGTATLLVRRWDGLSWVALFNQRSSDPKLPDSAIDPALHRAAAAVERWPEHDLFGHRLGHGHASNAQASGQLRFDSSC